MFHCKGLGLRGATWSQSCPHVCIQKGRKWVLCRLQVNKINENMLFKMGDNFAASVYMCKKFLDV